MSMKGLQNYSVEQPMPPNTYYTIWDAYRSNGTRAVPSYAYLQTKNQPKHGLYPMDWNFHGAKKLVTDIQRKHNSEKVKARRDGAESAVVRQYSRDMFEHALNDLLEGSGCRRNASTQPTKKCSSLRERPKTTGPTRHGSPIYNKRTGLLSSLRTRTAHQRDLSPTKNTNLISNNIETYSQMFGIVPKPSAQQLSIENATFIDKKWLYEREKTSRSGRTAISKNQQTIDNDKPAEIIIDTAVKPATPPAVLTSQPVISVMEPADTQIEQQNPQNTQSWDLLQVTPHSRPLSARSGATSVRSDRSSVPRVRTWVDDVSVSSDGVRSLAGSQSVTSKEQGVEPTDQHPVLPEPVSKPIVEFLDDADLTDAEEEPPGLVCPSSEDKSRAYAVLQWLAKCDFNKAIKTIPMT